MEVDLSPMDSDYQGGLVSPAARRRSEGLADAQGQRVRCGPGEWRGPGQFGIIGAMSPPPPSDRRDPQDEAHDVLAAEEYGVPAPDPSLHAEPAHDVLAAEEYAVPAPDPVLHYRGPVQLPGDPTGITEPHDVLAAEEFAMPAGHRDAAGAGASGFYGASAERGGRLGSRALLGLGAVVAVVALLRRKRSSSGTHSS